VTISSALFEAYIECPTKCWLRSRAEPSLGNHYAEWARQQNDAYWGHGLKRLLAMLPETDCAIGPLLSKRAKDATWKLAIDLSLHLNGLESHLHAIERIPSEARGRRFQLVPYRFQFANKITKNDKLALGFDAFVLSKAVGCEVGLGKIVHGDGHATLKVKVSFLAREVQKRIGDIASLLANSSPPELVLNRHCPQCEFQARCREQATEKDDLSLLSGMSGRECKKLHSKGIFTVTQLSYTFRPRRRRESQSKHEKFHHSLRALAIRANKIHAVDLSYHPELDGTPVYLDVEGLPDRDFYYLIGIRVGTGAQASQYGFWADDKSAEQRIWIEFLGVLSVTPNPLLIHYGSYETIFLKRMTKRYGGPRVGSAAATAIKDAENILTSIFARIYFPTFSNSLKEIAAYLGFRFSGSPGSGLEAIVLRHRWEASRDLHEKQALLDYNREDCEALELVATRLVDLRRAATADTQSLLKDVVRTSDMKRESPFGFKRNDFVYPEMETINKAAYWDYQRERVYLKSTRTSALKRERHVTAPSAVIKPNATIEYPRPSFCPNCRSNLVYRHGKRSKFVIDLRFMRYGIKRWVTRYVAQQYRCPSCRNTFYPPDRRWTAKKYGPNLIAYTIYQSIELRLPQSRVAAGVNKLFGLHIRRGTINRFKDDMAKNYRSAYEELLRRLCQGPLLHVDETSVSVMGKDGYVWVLTSMEDVAYFYTPTREGITIQTMLKEFAGVLVSDFFAAYEAIKCPQQKCLIHFIRDLNDELLNHPYDGSLKRLVREFACLMKTIVETVDRHGLKKRFLRKHKTSVDRFYRHLASGADASEAARKFVDRLQKNRSSMFTFLDFDDVPWNNNNAEHAVKAFVSLRRVIEGPTTEKGIGEFLVLLSLCETCRYRKLDFLDFLRSGLKNIDDFEVSQGTRRLQERTRRPIIDPAGDFHCVSSAETLPAR
jgi:predicted RecB family nuclease